MNSISKISKKIDYYNFVGAKVLGHCEFIQRLLFDKLVRASEQGVWKSKEQEEEFMVKIHKKIVPFKMQITAKFYELKSFEEIELDLHLQKLKTRVSGNNSYQEIKRKMNKLSAAN